MILARRVDFISRGRLRLSAAAAIQFDGSARMTRFWMVGQQAGGYATVDLVVCRLVALAALTFLIQQLAIEVGHLVFPSR